MKKLKRIAVCVAASVLILCGVLCLRSVTRTPITSLLVASVFLGSGMMMLRLHFAAPAFRVCEKGIVRRQMSQEETLLFSEIEHVRLRLPTLAYRKNTDGKWRQVDDGAISFPFMERHARQRGEVLLAGIHGGREARFEVVTANVTTKSFRPSLNGFSLKNATFEPLFLARDHFRFAGDTVPLNRGDVMATDIKSGHEVLRLSDSRGEVKWELRCELLSTDVFLWIVGKLTEESE